MQTFLPYASFSESAKVLDRQRLGKQRVETWQILRALCSGAGWMNHPVTKMWRGHASCLATYGIVICTEWIERGYRDTMLPRFDPYLTDEPISPSWLGDEAFHRSHRSNLLRKNPTHYREFWPDEPDDLPYVWPVMMSM